MLLLLFLIGLFILAIIFLPKILKKRKHDEVAEISEHFGLTPLETSVLRDLKHDNQLAPRNDILYQLCLKPIRTTVKQHIARSIIDEFPLESREYYNLYALCQQADTIEIIDRLYYEREVEAPRKAPSKHSARPIELEQKEDVLGFFNTVNVLEQKEDVLEFLNFIGDLEEKGPDLLQIFAIEQPLRSKHVYESKENVHALSSDCFDKAYKLIEKYGGSYTYEIFEEEVSLLILNAPLEKTNSIIISLERISTDNSSYGYKDKTFTLAKLCYAVLMYIKAQGAELQVELIKRLYEELESCSKKCGTGHLVRLMNALQGFSDEFEIKLSIKDEIYARLSTIIQRAIEARPDADNILVERDALIHFLEENRSLFTKQLVTEYAGVASEAEVKTQVVDSLNKYTKTTLFK